MADSIQELLLRISGDSSGAQSAVSDLSSSLNTAKQAIDAVKQSTDDAGAKTSALQKYLDDLVPSSNNLQASFADLKTTLTDVWNDPTSAVGEFASALTSDLGSALGATGVAIGVVAAAGVVAGTVLFELADHAASVGGSIHDLSEKTGIGAEALSQYGNAATVAGGSVDQIANAIYMFQVRMETTPDKVAAGLQLIGLSFDQIKSLKPEEQFQAIVTAINNTGDAATRNAAGNDLFGRSFRNIAPLVADLNDAMALTAGLEPFSDSETQQAKQFTMEVNALKLQFDSIALTLGRDVLPLVKGFVDLIASPAGTLFQYIRDQIDDMMVPLLLIKAWYDARFGTPAGPTLPAAPKPDINAPPGPIDFTAVMPDSEKYRSILHDITDGTQQLTSAEKQAALAAFAHGQSVAQAQKELSLYYPDVAHAGIALESLHKTYEDGVKHAQEYADATARVQVAEAGYRGVLDSLGDSVVEAIRSDLQHGAEMGDLAKIYEVNIQQVRIIKQELTDETNIRKELAKIEFEGKPANLTKLGTVSGDPGLAGDYAAEYQRNTSLITTADYKMTQAIEKDAGDTVAYQISKVHEWQDIQEGQINYGVANWKAAYDQIAAAAQAQITAIVRAHDPIWQAWKSLNADMRDEWAKTWEQALDGTKSFKDAALQPFTDLQTGLKKIFAGILADLEQQFLSPLLNVLHQGIGTLLNSLGVGGFGSGGGGLLGGAGGTGGGGLLGGFGGLFGGGASGNAGGTVGAFNDAGEWVPSGSYGQMAGSGGGGLFGNLFGGGLGGTIAGAGLGLTGGIGLLQNQGAGSDILSGAATGAAIGSIIPGLGTLIGGGIGALAGFIRSRFAGPSQQELQGRQTEAQFQQQMAQYGVAGTSGLGASVSGLQQQYVAAGMDASKAATQAQADFASLFAAEKQGGQAVQQVLAQITTQIQQQQQLLTAADQAAAKYGLTWQDMGQTVKQAHVDDELKSLNSDYDTLISKGIDENTALQHMGQAYSAYVRDVIASGSTIPASMQPTLQKLIDLGVLVDTNGQKIANLANVTFANLQTAGVQAATSVGNALSKITVQPIHVPVQLDASVPAGSPIDLGVPSLPDNIAPGQAHGGALVGDGVLQRFHVGTWSAQPVAMARFGLASDEVPAILQAGEAVIQRNAVAALGTGVMRAINAGNAAAAIQQLMPTFTTPTLPTMRADAGAADVGSGDMYITFAVEGDAMTTKVIRDFRYNKNGAYTKGRAALGISS